MASWIACHTRSAVHGMSMCLTPRWDTASTTALWMAGVEPMVPDSPMPLAPSGLRGLSVCGVADLEAGQLGRRRDGVVGQVRRDRVAVLVVDDLLEQRLRRALGDAAVLLAGDEQRVEDAPAVVDGDVAQQRHGAGLGVDLDDRDVRAERVRRVGAVEVELVAQRPGLHARRAAWPGRRRRTASSAHVTPFDGTPATCSCPSPTTMSSASASRRWAAICLALASTSLDATCTALPAVCSDREPIVPDAAGHRGGVGVDELDLVHRDAEDVAGEHGERGVVALAVDARADEHARRAVVVDLDRAVLDVQPDRRGDLDVGRQADAELLGVAVLPGAAPARRAARRSPAAASTASSAFSYSPES